jgi:ribose transport system substrate-binding protein
MTCRKIALLLVVAYFATVCMKPSEAAPATGKKPIFAWLGGRPIGWFENVGKGVARFAKENPDLTVLMKTSSDATAAIQADDMQAMVAQGATYLSVFPADATSINGIIGEMNEIGITSVIYGSICTLPTTAQFIVTTIQRNAATAQAEYLCKLMNYRGGILNVLENLVDPAMAIRRQALQDVIAKYPDMKIVQEIGDMKTIESAREGVSNAMAANLDQIDGIFPNAYNTGAATASVLSDYKAGGGKRDIKAVCWEVDPTVLKAIKEGYIEATFAQNSGEVGCGYISMYILKMLSEGYIKRPDADVIIDSGVVVITKDNIDSYQKDMEKMTEQILKDLPVKYLQKP